MTKRKICVAILIVVLCCGLLVVLSACEPLRYVGVTVNGVATNGVSQIELRSVNYQFNIDEYPMKSNRGFQDTKSNVAITYNYYNPTSSDITMPLYLVTNKPEYDFEKSMGGLERYRFDTDAAQQITLRCAYGSDLNYTFGSIGTSVEDFLKRIYDDKQYDHYYSSDLPVYKYTCIVTDKPSGADRMRVTFYGYEEGKIFLDRHVFNRDVTSDSLTNYYAYIHGSNTITIYSLGKPLDDIDQRIKLCDDTNKVVSNASCLEVVSDEVITLDDFAMISYEEESGLSKIDWYNAVLDYINDDAADVCSVESLNLTDELSYMYQCNLVVPAQTQVSQTVVVPLYPSIDGESYKEYVYEYNLDMSALSQWRGKPSIDLVVLTDGYYVKASHDLKQTAFGYQLNNISDSTKNISFTLSETPNFDKNESNSGEASKNAGVTILIVMGVFSLIPIVTVAIVLGVDRAKRNKSKKEEKTIDKI